MNTKSLFDRVPEDILSSPVALFILVTMLFVGLTEGIQTGGVLI